MRDLHSFFNNPFDDPGISMPQLLAYTSDHLARLTANSSLAVLTARITATTTAMAGVSSNFDDDETKAAVRKAKNQIKDDYRQALPANVEKVHAAMVAKVGSKSAVVTQCFPSGRSVFAKCQDAHVESHLNTIITGATANQATLGAQVATDATALLTGWSAVYGASETSAGDKAHAIIDKKTARANLQLELFRNLLTLALAFPRQPEMCDVFLQQNLLQDHTLTPAAPAPAPTPTSGP